MDFDDRVERYDAVGNLETNKKGRHMAGNPVPNDPDELLALAEDMADGLETLEAVVGVKQNTEAVMRAAIAAYRSADNLLGVAKAARGTSLAALEGVDDAARVFLLAARKVLALHIGESWSAAWEATGFPHQSTAVPRSQEERMNLCTSLTTYFTANPAQEAAQFGVTAALAEAAYTALSDARDDLAAKTSAVTTNSQARQAEFKQLRKRVRGLIDELVTLLEDDDPRWHEFGLSMPSDPDTPEQAGGLVLTPNMAGKVLAAWERAPRATRYRVFKQVLTVDVEPVNVETVHDTGYLLEGLPSGQTVKVHVIAANDAGEAAASDSAQCLVP